MTLIIIIVILLVILLNVTWKRCSDFFTMERVKSTVDFIEYPVISAYSDKAEAANIIGDINMFTINLIQELKKTYMTDKTSSPDWQKGHLITKALIARFNSNSLQENEPDSKDNTSYTTNKGEIISLCLREKLSGENKFHKPDIIRFVFLHEIAHVVTPEINHSPLFWENFKFLLDFCKSRDLYSSPDYSNDNIINYCGLDVNYTPSNDTSIKSYFS
jgi:hypothetical protein